jgi:exodeoxyribonuclease VII small subunit
MPATKPPEAPPARDVATLSFEDALGAYERGATLRRHCEAKLAEAEARVAAIVEHADGTLSTRDAD